MVVCDKAGRWGGERWWFGLRLGEIEGSVTYGYAEGGEDERRAESR
jgi:hypothetical protein